MNIDTTGLDAGLARRLEKVYREAGTIQQMTEHERMVIEGEIERGIEDLTAAYQELRKKNAGLKAENDVLVAHLGREAV